jgi:hypothetical protein
MPTPFAPPIIVAQNARAALPTLIRAHSTPQSLALRARLVLRSADCDRPSNRQTGSSAVTITRLASGDGVISTRVGRDCKMPCALGARRSLRRRLVCTSSPWPVPCPKIRIVP